MIKNFIPDKVSLKEAYKRSKYLAIVAHADDIEILAPKPAIERPGGFFGIIVADNKGGPLRPEYKKMSRDRIQEIREKEQQKAARLGKYSGVVFLRLASRDIRNPRKREEVAELIFKQIKDMPLKNVYTHSLFDNHPTHLAVSQCVISALKKLPLNKRPKAVYGMEVWGSLEWLPERYRVAFDLSSSINLIKELLSVYKSQSYVGHRYDRAVLGRLKANAIFSKTHDFSKSSALIYGMDLSRLIRNQGLTEKKYIDIIIKDFLKEKRSSL
jgi:LmbE family N-acetylglucosaminyl deacetylase